MFILALVKVRFSSQLLHNRLAFQCSSDLPGYFPEELTWVSGECHCYETVIWDCNLRVQRRVSSVGVRLCTVACYEHYLLLLGNQTKQQRIIMRSWAGTFWSGGGEGKKKLPQSQRILPLSHQPPSPSFFFFFFFSKVRAGLLPRNRPTLDLVLSITNLPKTQEHFFVRRARKQWDGQNSGGCACLNADVWSDGFWHVTIGFLRRSSH